MLPILLPPLAILCFPCWRRTPLLPLLFAGGAALAISTYPRMDLPHLTYAAPLFYAPTAILAVARPACPLIFRGACSQAAACGCTARSRSASG